MVEANTASVRPALATPGEVHPAHTFTLFILASWQRKQT